MRHFPSILLVRTQSWIQATRLTMLLAAYGCRIAIICSEDTNITQAPHVSARFHFSPANPVRSLRRAIVESGAEYVLPTDDLSVALLHEAADLYPELLPIVERSLGRSEFYPVIRSRFKLLALAHELGISVPRTELILNEEQLAGWSQDDRTSYVLKKDGTWGGEGVQIVGTADECRRAFQQMQRSAPWSARFKQWLRTGDGVAFARLECLKEPELTAQSLVDGIPANAMYACHEGRILGEVQAQVVASKGKTGASLVIKLIDDPRITRAGKILADALHLSGFFGLDFILDAKTGEPFLIELNPRATKLGHLSVANQPDLAGALWAQWSGEPIPSAAAAQLSPAICFHPEAELWTRQTAKLLGCRSDCLEGEEAMFTMLASKKPALRTRVRNGVWSLLLYVKGVPLVEPLPQTFYYQDLGVAADAKNASIADKANRTTIHAAPGRAFAS